MASFTTKGQNLNGVSNFLNGDEVVISGISGIFPNSDSVVEFMDNLYNKIDMVSSEDFKWKLNDPDVPKYMGKIKGTDKFDAQFFGVTFHLACVLEPMGRKLMEHTYGAIIDSGTSPQSLRGKHIGVFVGSSYADNNAIVTFDLSKRSDFVINGGSKAMFANRISYWIDGKGPSYALDQADASSTACLEVAYNSIKSGLCDAAIVGGCNYGIHPNVTLNMRRAGLLCLDGKTKCFDKNADGYTRSDAVNVIFLQKAKDAHRVYAEVYYAQGNYKMRPDAQFLPMRESEDIEDFLSGVYSKIDVDPNKVEYVEAQGAAIAKADENELKAISNIFAKDTSIKVGSVKSNMGNSESASGICSVTKLCLAYHKGKLPPNLHYNEPQDHIPAVRDGRIQVLSEQSDFNRGFTALNNFSFTGANFHVVLKGHYKQKNIEKYKTDIPYLILASGRQESGVDKIIDIVKNHPIDPEEIGLLHKIYENDIPGHTGRGYMLVDTNENNETVSLSESSEYYPGGKKPLWFVYSGMGSQWATMGADLMRIPTFAATIHKPKLSTYYDRLPLLIVYNLGETIRVKYLDVPPKDFKRWCHKVLEPFGIDLINILTDPDSTVRDNSVYAFVGIGAVQVGLTDMIKEMGIVPDGIIGHSLGELACAYHDNLYTAEQMVLCNYLRAKTVFDSPKEEGLMAAVGLGYQAIVNQCPPEIDIACHNSSESSTISGPVDKVKEFVRELTKRGIFAKEVQCGGTAYHSRYIAHCAPELLKKLDAVITNPKKRSNKWLSTSVPQDRWHEKAAMYLSAEYLVNNMTNPVLFEEMTRYIPDNAIVVEIAPHGLLQAILKRSHKDCTHVPLASRGNPNGVQFFLEAVGKLYKAGVNPKIDVLYPKIEFPVSTETCLLSHYVDWEHSEDWPEYSFLEKDEIKTASARNFVMSIYDDDYKFLEGHVRDGINVLPESAILMLVWETLSMHTGVNYQKQSVIFSDIQFHSEVVIERDTPLRLFISISRASDKFEVSFNNACVTSGVIIGVKVLKFYQDVEKLKNLSFDDEIITLESEDIYKLLESRGFSYRGKFKTIQESNLDYEEAYIEWNKNWITFLDSLIQFNTIAHDYNGVSVPKFIRKLRINVEDQEISKLETVNGLRCFCAKYNKTSGVIRCAGVELDNVTFTDKPVVQKQPDILLSKSFYPHYSMDKVDLKTALHINLQIVAENTTMNEIKVTQIVTSNTNLNCIVKEISDNVPNATVEVASVLNVSDHYGPLLATNTDFQKANMFIIENLLDDEKKLKDLRNISNDTFIIALESGVPKLQGLTKYYFSVVSAMSDGKQILILLRRQHLKDVTYVRVNCDNKLDWVSHVYDGLHKTKRIVLLSEKQPYCGALGFVNKLRKDGESKIALMSTVDFRAPAFHPTHTIYEEQLEKNLNINILKKGEWGGLYYTPATTRIKIRNATLTSPVLGDLNSLTWTEAPAIPASNHLVQVSYAGISLKDVEKVIYSHDGQKPSFGMDYSGIDINGERVMGLIPGGALSSTVEADPDLKWPVPEHWTLQDAATVPLPYAMAYYCMTIKDQFYKGQRVLVTGGAGALGQAIIALCISLECTIYVTVSNEFKKKMLLRLYPQLDENRIGNSHDGSYLTIIKTETVDGCDIVINCASGYSRETAMKCLHLSGTFLDLNTYDMNKNQPIGLYFFHREKSYKAVNFSNIFRRENRNDKKILQHRISEGIAKGVVKPISRIEYLPTAVSRAFRLLSSSKHVGKVLIKMRSPEIMSQGFEVVPRMNYCPNGVYIVICDETGLGIEVADRLIKRGVRKIILHLRSKVSGYLQTKFVSWQKYGVTIKISTDNIQTQDGCTKLVKEAARIGSVKGIFILQFPENDKNSQDFVQKLNKAIVVINLDLTSRNYCNELSHFVLLTTSSPYASEEFAISVSENVFETRYELGAPALVVKAEGLIGCQKSNIYSTQSLSEFFNAMETGLKLKYNNILSYNVNKIQNSEYLGKLAKVLGIPKLENIDNETLVASLSLNENNLEELKMLIRNTYQINYHIKELQRSTIESLKTIGSQTAETKLLEGLRVFYTNIDDEEQHMATSHPIVPMITLLNNGIENDLDPAGTYLVLIPGFEGRHQVFDIAAERLKVQAVAVQLACNIEGNTIPEIAATVRKFMKTKFETKSKFYLLGYSFGVNIALELAALLEKEGHIGVVFCLDSSPDVLRTQLNTYLGDLSDSELQNAVLEHIYGLLTEHETQVLRKELEETHTWSDKVDVCMTKMIGLANFSNQYKRSIIESAYNRILLAKEYEPNLKLESDIVLISGNPHPRSDSLPKDYNLSKYTKQPVRVFHIGSDHPSAPYDCRVSNIVNKLLDGKLLQEFQNKNQCDSYRVPNF